MNDAGHPAPAPVRLGDREVGPGRPVFVVAELSANHGHDYDTARRLVEAAARAGADAVKVQTYTPDTLTIACDRPEFRIGTGTQWEGRTLHDLYAEAHMPWDWQPRLMAAAAELGVPLFSTPFDEKAVDFLEDMGVACHKIASFELVDLPLIRKAAATGKPLIMSTGMASADEVAEAVATARAAGAGGLVLLKCTSAYPATPDSMNLRTIGDLAARFGVPAGLSDHTLGIAVPVAAVALGACMVEKHITLRRADGGPDAAFSLEPDEFGAMVQAVRVAEQALGEVRYGVGVSEEASRVFRRSLFVVADVAAGEELTTENVRAIRPGYGLHTRHLDEVLGRRASRDIARGTPLGWELVASGDPAAATIGSGT
ncbi:pseudaminic acid synthase [bacterium]|nr:pseudaminic acid synthase [bacterium]